MSRQFLKKRLLRTLPLSFHVVGEVHIEPLAWYQVESFQDQIEDVTSHQSKTSWRERAIVSVVVFMQDGTVRHYHPEEFRLAYKGGGDFLIVQENQLHDRPLTFFRHCLEKARERKRAADEAFLDWY